MSVALPTPFVNFFSLLRYGVVSQVIYFLTIPIILGKFSAAGYGIFTIVFSVTAIVGTVSALRVERAIVVEETHKIRSILIHCGIYILLSSAACYFISLLALISFDLEQTERVTLSSLSALFCLASGLIQVLTHLSIREEQVRLSGISDATNSILLVFLLLVFKPGNLPETILLMSIFLGAKVGSLLPFSRLSIKENYFRLSVQSSISFNELRRYYLPVLTAVLSNIQFRGLFYLAGLNYGPAVTGNLSITHRIVYAPVNLIGASLRKSFFLEFTKSAHDFEVVKGHIQRILTLFSLASLVLFPVFILGTKLGAQYLPNEWGLVPQLAIALYPVASVLILLSWLDRIYDAKKLQHLALFYEGLFTFFLYFCLLLCVYNFETDHLDLILLFSWITVLYNILWAFLTFRLIAAKYRAAYLLASVHLVLLLISTVYLR